MSGRFMQRRSISCTAHCGRAAILRTENLPSVAQPSLWLSMMPRALREWRPGKSKLRLPKPWNPATFYIIIFLLIGSQAIQILGMRQQYAAFARKADARIELLQEVIGRVQKGEDVDVEGLLGTGDPEQEKEWEQGKSDQPGGHAMIVLVEYPWWVANKILNLQY